MFSNSYCRRPPSGLLHENALLQTPLMTPKHDTFYRLIESYCCCSFPFFTIEITLLALMPTHYTGMDNKVME